MDNNIIKFSISSFSGLAIAFLSNFWNVYGWIIVCVCVAILFDLFSKLIACGSRGTLNATECRKGFWKKCATIGIFVTSIFIDFFVTLGASQFLNLDSFHSPIGVIIGVYITITELISIISNFSSVNNTVTPKWLTKLLKASKKSIDDMKGD